MIDNCKVCGDRFYLRFYPLKSQSIKIECPKCHGKYSLTVTGAVEHFFKAWEENDPELVDRLAQYYYYVPPEEHEGGRWPDLEQEYQTDTTSTAKSVRIDMRLHGHPFSSNFPNDVFRISYWDKLLDENFKSASFNLTHINHNKRDQFANFGKYL